MLRVEYDFRRTVPSCNDISRHYEVDYPCQSKVQQLATVNSYDINTTQQLTTGQHVMLISAIVISLSKTCDRDWSYTRHVIRTNIQILTGAEVNTEKLFPEVV